MHRRQGLAFIALLAVSQVLSFWPPFHRIKMGADGNEGSPGLRGLSSPETSDQTDVSGAPTEFYYADVARDASSASALAKRKSSSKDDTGSGASSGGPYDGRSYQGEATTYDSKWSIGNCLLSNWPQPKGLGPVAIAQNLWDSSRMCGACVSITSSFGTYLGIVTDQSDVKPNSLDLGPDVWSQVSNHQKSSALPITWHIVPCNLLLQSNFTMRVARTHIGPQSKSLVRTTPSNLWRPVPSADSGDGDSSEWIELVRQSNANRFSPPKGKGGLGTSADLRVTCNDGKQFITKGVNLIDSSKPTAASGNC
ncbi:hypothetical protein PSTT_00383 [Puccinia striiformis]|uniref:Expansin-like EG45 domain-containing protein n=1 Tax=Puccinia striiformis TaxID=27350 RepID=A0A2S4W772_9BASI|nr:hypothetical protein PSTT_00383 [Puccinia striiformis]